MNSLKKLILSIIFLLSILGAGAKSISILIDPGHGGKDPGQLSLSKNLMSEKDLALLIAKKLGHYLEHNLANVDVLYTRTSDIYPSLDERVQMANSKNVDYMLSIHCKHGCLLGQ